MSENGSGERMVLNWRGPLLAAGIFAGVFGILLLMAHLNQSKTTDEGSSFREDPYGTSLLFDSYRHAGYEVKRSQDENALADQDATRTTAFFVGGNDSGDVETHDRKIVMGGKFHSLLEEFLGRGGRVVLIEHDPGISVASLPEPDHKSKPRGLQWKKEKNWGVETKYDAPGKHESNAAWAGPSSAMPAGSELMYLAADAPWLKIDKEWAALYAGPVQASDASGPKTKSEEASPQRVYMARRRVGNGELIVASQKSFLFNEAIKTHANPLLLDFLVGGRSVIWIDETLHGLHQEQGVLWLVQRYRLQGALLLFWATLLSLLWSMGGDLPRRPARDRSAEILRQGESAGVAAQRLLQRSIAAEQVVAECWDHFRRRSPQDAEAISADPRWGPRLRAALAQAPVAGYKELSVLIAERRASARGVSHKKRDAHNSAAANAILEEARSV